jgi:hypothetical protein
MKENAVLRMGLAQKSVIAAHPAKDNGNNADVSFE